MKKFFLLTLLSSVSLLSFGQYDPDALAVLNAMSAKYKNMGAYEASFTQEMVNKTANVNESIKGSITVKGNKYLLKVAGQEIYNNGKDVYSYSEELAEVTVNTYQPEEEEITLSNIYDLYKSGFKYILMATSQNGDRTVELDPESKDKSYYKIKLVVDKGDNLKKFTVMEKSGNTYVYTIESFAKKTGITDAFFTFDESKHPNVEVIDFR